ncbi:MAG: AarF/ABC1/UbiB kinase family protein [Acidobacteriota bacterium]
MTSAARTEDYLAPTVMSEVAFRATLQLTAWRFLLWCYAAACFVVGNLFDVLTRRDSVQRRGERLRRIFEQMGGTFLKFGQQLAMRVDLLPYVYCIELGKMLDEVPPLPTAEAVAIVERELGRPLGKICQAFDPSPIGSASIACVYRAVLRGGQEVAIKVQRPSIGRELAADVAAFRWLTRLARAAGAVRPGILENVVDELQDTLKEEIDFRKEARYQELFRRRARKSGKRFFTAPRVYPDLSTGRVLTQQFVAAMALKDVLAANERKSGGQQLLRELDIKPSKVARRMMWVNYWGMMENLFFHADPHPANILVKPGSRLVFIDFGSCGAFSRGKILSMQEFSLRYAARDVTGMAESILGLLEPLPPKDIEALIKELEAEYRQVVYAIKSKHSEWWERTTAKLWLSFIRISRKYEMPMQRDALRMVRASLLYDTLAVRLDRKLDYFKEFKKYLDSAGKRAHKRLRKRAKRALRHRTPKVTYLRLEQMVDAGSRLLHRFDRLLDQPLYKMEQQIDKWVYLVMRGVSAAVEIVAIGTVFYLFHRDIELVLGNPWFVLLAIIPVLRHGMQVRYRLGDLDP